MSKEIWTVVGLAAPNLVLLLTSVIQNWLAQRQRIVINAKVDEIHNTTAKTQKAVDGHLTTVTNELALTSRALADSTGMAKDEVRAITAEKNASDHAREGLK